MKEFLEYLKFISGIALVFFVCRSGVNNFFSYLNAVSCDSKAQTIPLNARRPTEPNFIGGYSNALPACFLIIKAWPLDLSRQTYVYKVHINIFNRKTSTPELCILCHQVQNLL